MVIVSSDGSLRKWCAFRKALLIGLVAKMDTALSKEDNNIKSEISPPEVFVVGALALVVVNNIKSEISPRKYLWMVYCNWW